MQAYSKWSLSKGSTSGFVNNKNRSDEVQLFDHEETESAISCSSRVTLKPCERSRPTETIGYSMFVCKSHC